VKDLKIVERARAFDNNVVSQALRQACACVCALLGLKLRLFRCLLPLLVTHIQNDNDNLQSETMTLVARSRGVIWLMIPGGMLVTGLCDALNSPPFLLAEESKLGPKLGLVSGLARAFGVDAMRWLLVLALSLCVL
jgi:hypothetical protein